MAQMAEAGTTAGENRTIALIGAGHFLSHFYALTLPPLFLFFREEFSVSYALLGALVTGYAMVRLMTRRNLYLDIMTKIYRRDIALCAQFPYIDLVYNSGEALDHYDSYDRRSHLHSGR